MEKKSPDIEVIAANLTAAAHVYMLSMQLRGERVTLNQAITTVSATYRYVLAHPQLLDLGDPHEWQSETTLAPSPTSAPAQAGEAEPISPTDYTAHPSLPDEARPDAEGTVLNKNTTPPDSGSMTGSVLDGRYRVLQALGAGGMGQVYLGEQLSTGRTVALKMLPALEPHDLPAALSFFEQEAAALAKLNHPNIAQVYDASVAGQSIFIAMEYVEGELLRHRLQRERILPIADVVRIIRETCMGLEAAHQAGIIHRDIKPENLMLIRDESERPRIKILDFGLAILDDKDAANNITGAGTLAGTPTYMSPEQVNGLEVTPATDVYSLGIVAYEMLTGVNPFRGANPWQTMQNHLHLQPPPISQYNPQVPPELEAIVLRALEKDPQQRFADGGQWLQVF